MFLHVACFVLVAGSATSFTLTRSDFTHGGGKLIAWEPRSTITVQEFPCVSTGFYPHPKNCSRFYRCIDFTGVGDIYTRYLFECEKGSVFADTIDSCVPGVCPERVEGTDSITSTTSQGSAESTPDATSETEQSGSDISTDTTDGSDATGGSGSGSLPESVGQQTVQPPSVQGTGVMNCTGRYVQQEQFCNLFHKCEDLNSVFSCYEGTAFSEQHQMCRLQQYDKNLCEGKKIFVPSAQMFREAFNWDQVSVLPYLDDVIPNANPFIFTNMAVTTAEVVVEKAPETEKNVKVITQEEASHFGIKPLSRDGNSPLQSESNSPVFDQSFDKDNMQTLIPKKTSNKVANKASDINVSPVTFSTKNENAKVHIVQPVKPSVLKFKNQQNMINNNRPVSIKMQNNLRPEETDFMIAVTDPEVFNHPLYKYMTPNHRNEILKYLLTESSRNTLTDSSFTPLTFQIPTQSILPFGSASPFNFYSNQFSSYSPNPFLSYTGAFNPYNYMRQGSSAFGSPYMNPLSQQFPIFTVPVAMNYQTPVPYDINSMFTHFHKDTSSLSKKDTDDFMSIIAQVESGSNTNAENAITEKQSSLTDMEQKNFIIPLNDMPFMFPFTYGSLLQNLGLDFNKPGISNTVPTLEARTENGDLFHITPITESEAMLLKEAGAVDNSEIVRTPLSYEDLIKLRHGDVVLGTLI